ncbi:MAG TPA: hypothetical protein VMZ73_06895 [Acidimicrobiales bacterium]|nr:hypothetical protein [Acidimicrobiales bacterium]
MSDAPRLGFADERTRTRRDHMKYLALIRAIALLHQHQRSRQTVTHAGREVAYIVAAAWQELPGGQAGWVEGPLLAEPYPDGMDQPPVDPQDWTDEQWLEWLEATDGQAAVPGEEGERGGERPTVAERVRASPAARGMGGAMVALHEIFYRPKDDEVVIVAQAGGDPPDPDALELDLDPDHPEESTATIPATRRRGRKGAGGDGR